LFAEVIGAGEGEVNRAVEDERGEMIGVSGGVGLRELRAVTFAVEPQFVVAYELPEGFEVFDSLAGAEVIEVVGWLGGSHSAFATGRCREVVELFGAVAGEGLGGVEEGGFAFEGEGAGVGVVKLGDGPGALKAARQAHAALIEEDEVEVFGDGGVEAVGVRIGGGDARCARPAGGGDEESFALTAGAQKGEGDGDERRVGVEVVERSVEGNAGEAGVWAEIGWLGGWVVGWLGGWVAGRARWWCRR